MVSIEGKWSIVYTCLTLKQEFAIVTDEHDQQRILFPENSSIANAKMKLDLIQTELSTYLHQVEEVLEQKDVNRGYLRFLLERQRELQGEMKTFTKTLEKLYENELIRLDDHDPSHFCASEVSELHGEMDNFIKMLDIGLKDTLEEKLDNVFGTQAHSIQDKCLLLYQIVEQLFLTKPSGTGIQKDRIKSAVHALSVLVSMKSQMIKNDFKLLFSVLCVSYGAGMRFINMQNHLGLCVSWDTVMNFFDTRMRKFSDFIDTLIPVDILIICLLDNINLYKGRRRHLRLFKYMAPTVWNFTGQAIMKPQIGGFEEMFKNKETAVNSQRDPLFLKPEDIFFTSDKSKVEMLEKYKEMYFLDLMSLAYNNILGLPKKELRDLTESEFDEWLKNTDFSKSKINFMIDIPEVTSIIRSCHAKTDIHILPLSLEDNSTIAGTASIFDDWIKTFNLPSSDDKTSFISFDFKRGSLDIQLARSRVEYLNSKYRHQSYMAVHETELRSKEKALYGLTDSDMHSDDPDDVCDKECDDDSCIEKDSSSCTLDNEKGRFRREDEQFWLVYNELAGHK